jgi:hypothetical protein
MSAGRLAGWGIPEIWHTVLATWPTVSGTFSHLSKSLTTLIGRFNAILRNVQQMYSS